MLCSRRAAVAPAPYLWQINGVRPVHPRRLPCRRMMQLPMMHASTTRGRPWRPLRLHQAAALFSLVALTISCLPSASAHGYMSVPKSRSWVAYFGERTLLPALPITSHYPLPEGVLHSLVHRKHVHGSRGQLCVDCMPKGICLFACRTGPP